jgi:hypothetical protein
LRRLSNGFFNPTGALFAVTAFSWSDGKSRLGARRKAQWTGGAVRQQQPLLNPSLPGARDKQQNWRNVYNVAGAALQRWIVGRRQAWNGPSRLNPRTLCACHPVAFMISARVARLARPINSRICAPLLSARGAGSLARAFPLAFFAALPGLAFPAPFWPLVAPFPRLAFSHERKSAIRYANLQVREVISIDGAGIDNNSLRA